MATSFHVLLYVAVCFSALLVGLFIDGNVSCDNLIRREVSVPFWLGCSLMAENIAKAGIVTYVSVPFWLGCSLMAPISGGVLDQAVVSVPFWLGCSLMAPTTSLQLKGVICFSALLVGLFIDGPRLPLVRNPLP